jgi:hypothetical protein
MFSSRNPLGVPSGAHIAKHTTEQLPSTRPEERAA